MSAIVVNVSFDAQDLIDALEKLGATVTWHAPKAASNTHVDMNGSVEADEAYDALPSHYFDRGDDEWLEPEAPDFHDFVRACAAGDRSLAVALLPRLHLSDAGAWAGERALTEAGR